MMRVYKYTFKVLENEGNGVTRAEVTMPKFAGVIAVGSRQEGQITLWAEVDPNQENETRTFWAYGTGREIDFRNDGKYLGTAFDGPYVWHVYGNN